MKSDTTVPTKLLATATTSSTGQYTLQVPAAALKAAAVESGYANLEIDSPSGIRFLSYQTTTLPAHSSAPVTVNLSAKKSKWSCGYNSNGAAYGFTGFAFQRPRAKAWAVVGQGYVAGKKTAGDWVKFKYDSGANHTQASALGVGISGYGFDGGYNGAGSHTSDATRTETFAKGDRNSWFRTEFKTGQFRGECIGTPYTKVPRVHQNGQCPKKSGVSYVHKCIWMIQSTGWFGGTSTTHPKAIPHTPVGNCAPHEKDSNFSGDYGSAVQWSHGFDLGAALGIKGVTLKGSFSSSAHTGYDANAYMDYWFHQKGDLCGTNASEASAAILVQRGS